MDALLRELIEAQNQLTEADWKQLAAGAAIAGTLLTGVPNADAKSIKPQHHHVSQVEKQINLEKLMAAIKQVESSGGLNKNSRYEIGIKNSLLKRYNVLNLNVKNAIDKYGVEAVATSYGPWQILASTAYDLGYVGSPIDLSNENVSKKWAIKYINNIINSSKTNNVQDVISAYNAGLGNIGHNPEYIQKVLKYYE